MPDLVTYGPWALIAGGSEGVGAEFATQLADDGFNLGILYRGDRRPYQPAIGPATIDLAELEEDFAL